VPPVKLPEINRRKEEFGTGMVPDKLNPLLLLKEKFVMFVYVPAVKVNVCGELPVKEITLAVPEPVSVITPAVRVNVPVTFNVPFPVPDDKSMVPFV
jgi:hypothetical protein